MNVCQEMKPALVDGALASESAISYRLATTPSELEEAFNLVRNAYVRVGLHAKNAHSSRITKYHLLPGAKVFVAVARDSDPSNQTDERIVGTLTVVPDGALGLPADAVAEEGIETLRRADRRAAEFIALAADDEGSKNRVILKLFRLAYEYCRITGIRTIFASLTERHIGFYQRFLGFKPIGELKPYEMGNGIPVQVHFLDVYVGYGQIEYRSRALDRDATWQHFWLNELHVVLNQAKVARPWSNRLLHFFLKKNRELRLQLDSRTIELINKEYHRFGQKLVTVAS